MRRFYTPARSSSCTPFWWIASCLVMASILSACYWSSTVKASDGTGTSVKSSEDRPTHADHTNSDHEAPVSPILLELAIIIGMAMLGRSLAEWCGQSSVMGELLIGVLLGNLGVWLGIPFFVMVMHLGEVMSLFGEVWLTGRSVADSAQDIFPASAMAEGGSARQLVELMTGLDGLYYVSMGFALWLLSQLGVTLLLFMVGLETRVEDMLHDGPRSFVVAIIGVASPFVLGILAGMWLLPEAGITVHLFLAATLCATSIGITARVFRDLGKLHTREGRIILGAAVIDDVFGLIILAVVIGIASTGQVDLLQISHISLLSILFLGSALLLGGWFVSRLLPIVAAMERRHVKLLFPLGLAFFLSWAVSAIELAPIIGAFTAGLILNEEQFAKHSPESTMANVIAPLERVFAPIFFVLMGMQVNLQSFLDPTTLRLALAFSVLAVIGKLACGLFAGPGTNRLAVGLGMVPRGEVGLIIAGIGKGMGIVSASVFSAIVVTVIATTLVTPPALKWSLVRKIENEVSSEKERTGDA